MEFVKFLSIPLSFLSAVVCPSKLNFIKRDSIGFTSECLFTSNIEESLLETTQTTSLFLRRTPIKKSVALSLEIFSLNWTIGHLDQQQYYTYTQHYFIAQNYLTKNLRCAVSIREFAETYRVTSDQTIEQHFEHCHSSSSVILRRAGKTNW